MSADKYPSIFSRQTEAFVYLTLIFFLPLLLGVGFKSFISLAVVSTYG